MNEQPNCKIFNAAEIRTFSKHIISNFTIQTSHVLLLLSCTIFRSH